MRLLYCSWGENAQGDVEEFLRAIDPSFDIFVRSTREYLGESCAKELEEAVTEEITDVFSFDFLPLVSRICRKKGKRYISWIYDWPNYTVFAPEAHNSCNQIYFFEKDGIERLRRLGVKNVYYMPLAVNTERLDRQLGYGNEINYKYDVSFVGNLYLGKNEAMFSENIPEYYSGFVDALVNAQQRIYGYNLVNEVVTEAFTKKYFETIRGNLGDMGADDSFVLASQINRYATGIERRNLLKLSGEHFSTHLFTNRANEDMGGVCIHDGVDYYTQMPEVFRDSKINLNITLRSITSGVPLRVFDILGAGGFCLTNYQEGIAQHFEDGRELVMFTDPEDFLWKLEYYMTHDEERAQIARNGHEKVKEFNYAGAFAKMFCGEKACKLEKKFSVCMITKNEADKLERCLKSLKGLDCELVVVDTGSTDRTKEVIERYADVSGEFVWCKDFSKARNYSISLASCDLIMVLDTDEYIEKADIEAMLREFRENPELVGRIERINTYSIGGSAEKFTERISRVFDRRFYKYQGRIHEQVVRRDGKKLINKDVLVSVGHTGYAGSAEERREKASRNIELLQMDLQEYGPDPYILYQLGKGYYMSGQYREASEAFEEGLGFDLEPALEYVQDMVETYAYSLLQQKRYPEMMFLENIYKEFARSADYVFLMGLAYMNNGRFDEAIEQFEKAASYRCCKVEGCNSFKAYYNAGVVCECLGRTERAREYYRKCGGFAPAKAGLDRLGK